MNIHGVRWPSINNFPKVSSYHVPNQISRYDKTAQEILQKYPKS